MPLHQLHSGLDRWDWSFTTDHSQVNWQKDFEAGLYSSELQGQHSRGIVSPKDRSISLIITTTLHRTKTPSKETLFSCPLQVQIGCRKRRLSLESSRPFLPRHLTMIFSGCFCIGTEYHPKMHPSRDPTAKKYSSLLLHPPFFSAVLC